MSAWFHESSLATVDTSLDFCFGYWRYYTHSLPVQRVTKHFVDLPDHPVSARNVSSLPGENQIPVSIVSHPVRHAVSMLELGRSALRYVPVHYRRHYVEIVGSFEQYLQCISRKRRCELRRKMRKFAEAGSAFFREYRSVDEMPAFYDLALAVSRQSFQKRVGCGLPQNSEWLERLIQLAERGAVRGYMLFFGDRPAAFTVCRVNGTWLTGEHCGYDSALSQLSPGSVLIAYLLQQLFAAQEFKALDFGTGDAPYKAFFATGSIRCADVYYFQRDLKNSMLVIAHASPPFCGDRWQKRWRCCM